MSAKFLRNTVFGFVSAMSMTLGSFAISLVVARLLGVAQTGTYTFAIWIITMSAAATGTGLPFTMSRYLPEALERRGRAGALELASCYLRPSAALNLIPLLASLGYAVWLSTTGRATNISMFPMRDPCLWILIGCCCSVQALSDYSKGYLRGLHRLDRVAKLSLTSVVLQILFVFIGTFTFGIRGTLAGFLLGALVPLVALTDLAGSAPAVPLETRQRIRKYRLNRWVTEIAAALVFARIEVVYLQMTSTSTNVGLLSAAIVLANLATLAPVMMTWGLLPHLSEKHARRDERGLNDTYRAGTRMMAFMVFPLSFGLAAILPDLVPTLFGKSFAGAAPAATCLVLAASCTSLALIGNNVIWATERVDLDVRFGIAAFFVSVGLGLPLTAKFGLPGAVAARVVTQLLVATLATRYVLIKLRFAFPLSSVIRIGFAAAICAGAAKGFLFYRHGLIGLVVAIPLGAIVYAVAIAVLRPLEPRDAIGLGSLVQKLPHPFASFGERLLERYLNPRASAILH